MLALWEYFWEPTDWSPAIVVAPPEPTPTTSGGAKGKDYYPRPDSYWEEFYYQPYKDETKAEREAKFKEEIALTRNRRIKRLLNLQAIHLREAHRILHLRSLMDAAIDASHNASNIDTLYEASTLLKQLTVEYENLIQRYKTREISLQLLGEP